MLVLESEKPKKKNEVNHWRSPVSN